MSKEIKRERASVEVPSRASTNTLRSNDDKPHEDDKTGGEAAAATDAEPPSEAPVADSNPAEGNYSAFSTWEKRGIVLGASLGALLSPLTAQIYLPALGQLADEFDVTIAQINLTITTYMIFQGLTPMFVGSFADTTGRRPGYLICFVIYIAADIGCALAPSYPAMLVLRMLQSAGSSTTVALCQAVVSDVVTSAERGQYVGITMLPSLLGPALGPVLGGLISQYLGWRWIFWILALLGGAMFLATAAFLPETCRYIVGDGSAPAHRAYWTLWQLLRRTLRKRGEKKKEKERRALESAAAGSGGGGGGGADLQPTQSRASTTKQSFPARRKYDPWKSLAILFEKEMALLLSYSSIVFAGFYAVAATLSTQVEAGYGFDDVKIGLMYLPLAGGCVVAALAMGRLVNWNYRRHCRLQGVPFDRKRQADLSAFPVERARLEVGAPGLVLGAAAIAAWGWALQYRAHLAVLCVLLFLIGVAIIGFSNAVNIAIVDMNPGSAGAATASNNISRCLVGAAATAVIDPMISGVGTGWAFVIIAGLYVAGAPAVLLVMRNGVRWRREKAERVKAREEAREAAQGDAC